MDIKRKGGVPAGVSQVAKVKNAKKGNINL
jgi:hypothetical protein